MMFSLSPNQLKEKMVRHPPPIPPPSPVHAYLHTYVGSSLLEIR